MLKTVMFYTAAMVGTYLVVAHATDAGKLLTSGGSAYAASVKALQGRG